MVEKKKSEEIQLSDIETIIKVNNKAIELQTATSDQNEEIISLLSDLDNKMDNIISKQASILESNKEILKEVKEINKTEFKIMILLSSGMISLIVQVISLLLKK